MWIKIILDLFSEIFKDALNTNAEEVTIEKVEGEVVIDDPTLDNVLSKFDRLYSRN